MRPRPQTITGKETTTQQHMANEVNINQIIKRAQKTGQLPVFQNMKPSYADVSQITSYQDAVLMIQRAQDDFMALPGSVRARFDHDPGKLLAFLSDEKNREEAVKLGLVPEEQKPQQKEPEKGSEKTPAQ